MIATIFESGYYYPVGFAVRLVNTIVGFIEGAFVLRIILQLLGANPGSEFVAWVYEVTSRLLGPFAGALPTFVIRGNMVLELSVILAMIAYSILGWLIIRFLYFFFSSTGLFVTTVGNSEDTRMPLRGL